MRKRLLARRPSPAMVVAVVALVSSLTGGAVAATLIRSGDIAKNAVKGKHIANGKVKSKHIANGKVKNKDLKSNNIKSNKVRNGSLLSEDFAPGELPGTGPQGEKGEKGDKGDKGDPAVALFASVDTNGAAQPALGNNSGATDAIRINTGNYRVDFGGADLAECSYQVSSAEFNENQSTQVELDVTDSTRLAVTVHDADAGTNVDGDFNVAVHC